MIIILLLTTLFISFYTNASCEITFFPNIYLANSYSTNDLQHTISSSTCSPAKTLNVAKHLAKYNGTVSSRYLISTITTDEKIFLKPPEIIVKHLHNEIKLKLYPNRNAFVTGMKIFHPSQIISLTNNQKLQMKCNTCTSFGNKNIELSIINNENGASKTIWAKAKIQTTITALISLSHQAYSSAPLRSKHFVSKQIQTTTPTQYFTQINQLSYFKANKPILRETALKNSDLSPIFLVSPSKRAEVLYKSKTLQLVGIAIPRERGKHGDLIQLSNPRTGKILLGKVIGENKVLVQL